MRLDLYRRLAGMEDESAIAEFGIEMVDRFGEKPSEVDQLLQVMQIKVLCRRANVEKVEGGAKGITVSFRDNSFADPAGLVGLCRRSGADGKGARRHEDRLHARRCRYRSALEDHP